MPEAPEVRIMSDFINKNSKDKKFTKIFNIEKGNIPTEYLESEFTIISESNGKELKVNLHFEYDVIPIYVFMGMSGNWKYVPTDQWNETKFSRLRIDDVTGNSLILYGGYMGPKYSINKPFGGVKRGPDSTKNFDKFKQNILDNLDKKDFDKPICEVLLNQKYFNGVGAYLNAEIIGRLDFDPFRKFNSFSKQELDSLFNMIVKCCNESYLHGGGELKDWYNPFNFNSIKEWISYYGNKKECVRQKFGTRNIWIQKKFKPNSPI